jgi:hypothetical protein
MHQKKFSHEHHPSKQGNFNKDFEKKLDMNSLVQDLNKPKMSEKEFYEKCKQYLDSQTEVPKLHKDFNLCRSLGS